MEPLTIRYRARLRQLPYETVVSRGLLRLVGPLWRYWPPLNPLEGYPSRRPFPPAAWFEVEL